MADIKRTAQVVWNGSLREGKGQISSESKALEKVPYSFGTRFQDIPGTNPEELIAAAHAACYSMALAGQLAQKGYDPQRIATHATCFLVTQPKFRITKMHLQVRAQVPNIDSATFQQVAKEAEGECPVSNVLRNGLEIELDAGLQQAGA